MKIKNDEKYGIQQTILKTRNYRKRETMGNEKLLEKMRIRIKKKRKICTGSEKLTVNKMEKMLKKPGE